MKNTKILVLFLIAVLLTGCIGLRFKTFSKAVIFENTEQMEQELDIHVGKVFTRDGISFTVNLGTTKETDVLILPFPWITKSKPATTSPMYVLICIKSNKVNTILNPEKLILWKEGVEKLHPTGMYTPFDYIVPKKFTKEDKMVSIKPIELKKDVMTCVNLVYNSVPFSLSDKIFMAINGLEIDGNPYPLPVITFEKAKKVETFTIP